MDEPRQRRIARNESRFREVNESLKHSVDAFREGSITPDEYQMLCECARESCEEMVEISGSAYEAVRADGARFVVVPGHVVEDVERAVEQREAYWVIEKLGAGRDEAERRAGRG